MRKWLDKDEQEESRGRLKTGVASGIKFDRIRKCISQHEKGYILLSSSDEDNPKYQKKMMERIESRAPKCAGLLCPSGQGRNEIN